MSSDITPIGEPTPRTKRVAAIGALSGVVITVVGLFAGGIMALDGLGELLSDPLVGPLFLYTVIGGAAVGGTVATLYARYRLLAPMLLALGVLASAAFRTWLLLRSPVVPLPGTPIELAFLAWPLVLLAALLAGSVERVFRSWRKSGEATD
ncbi:hypothetical protein HWV23_08590 [Natronomonas halophila]|uniref:hypothetical protein n=1 Tax=Natronomonas halophila TaxID=2747817 RepID=UPI0015B3B7B2|nr:hypothetical protein [Natronomonas halophila]QLD85776.1 hypothetical protein HWV23_08590 [Natronomonas halophila]